MPERPKAILVGGPMHLKEVYVDDEEKNIVIMLPACLKNGQDRPDDGHRYCPIMLIPPLPGSGSIYPSSAYSVFVYDGIADDPKEEDE